MQIVIAGQQEISLMESCLSIRVLLAIETFHPIEYQTVPLSAYIHNLMVVFALG